jgi:hypothetical protein
MPSRYCTEIGAAAINSTKCERNYYSLLLDENDYEDCEEEDEEISCVGAGLGGGFQSTKELHVIKYKQAMKTKDKDMWNEAVFEEHDRMVKRQVWRTELKKDVPKGAKILTSTWAMKKKASGRYRSRLNARGYEQVDGQYFDSTNISSPVTNDATIRIVMILTIIFGWTAGLIDVQGAFLCGNFKDGEEIYMEVPEVFERFYPKNVLLLLLQTIHGLRQAARAFWRELRSALSDMKYEKSMADPCLYFCWTMRGLIIWLSWIDECLVAGNEEGVLEAKEKMKARFDCDDIGELTEYVGCKVERTKDYVRFTQPVLLQSYVDEFSIESGRSVRTPAETGKVLVKGDEESQLKAAEQTKYRCVVGKLLHMMRWSRPEIYNSVRELSRFMTTGTTISHVKAMKGVMEYCVATENRGITLKPDQKWNGDPEFELIILGRSDSNFAKEPDTWKSVSGNSTFMCGAPVIHRSSMQKIVAVSVTEEELFAATSNAQDMMYVKRLFESIRLRVHLPMILEVDNKGAVDLVNNFSVGGRTRHIETRHYYLRELKEQGVISAIWKAGSENSSDMYTKNLGRREFEKHDAEYVGNDEYMQT